MNVPRVSEPLLSVEGLSIHFQGVHGEVQATRDISFALRPGERVGIVGESGCGKTVTGLSILGLLPAQSSRVTGRIVFEGTPEQLRANPALLKEWLAV